MLLKLSQNLKKYHYFFKKKFPRLNKYIIYMSPFFSKTLVLSFQKKDNKKIYKNLDFWKKPRFLFKVSYNKLLLGYVKNQDLLFLTGLVKYFDLTIKLLIIINILFNESVLLYKVVIVIFFLRMSIAIFESIIWHSRPSCWFVNPFEHVVVTTKVFKNVLFGKSATLSIIGTGFVSSCLWEASNGFSPLKALKCVFTEEYQWKEVWYDCKNSWTNTSYQNKTYYKWGVEPKNKPKIFVINLKK